MNRRVIVFFIIMSTLCVKSAFGESAGAPLMYERVIGSTIKNLAKAYILVADIDKLKKSNVAKLEKMTDAQFYQRYFRVYEIIRDLPQETKSLYGVNEQMTRLDVIAKVSAWDKDTIRGFITAIPDKVITDHFKNYLKRKRIALQKSSLAQQAQAFWERAKREIEG